MKYIIPCLMLMIGLSQCKKNDPSPADPNANNIFTVQPDPDYLLDTLTVSDGQSQETQYGYFFAFDNQNRVTTVKYYEYFFNLPVNNNGTWTFNYQGTNTNPVSMTQESYNNYKVYFFYNSNGSKNRDSIVSTANPSVHAVRKYTYDSAFNYVVVKHYDFDSTRPALRDSAIFVNYNCKHIESKQITWSGSIPYTYEYYDNYFSQMDTRPNPFTKMNIFPCLFLTPYLQLLGNKLEGSMWKTSIVMDFVFQNNPGRYVFSDYATGGYNYLHIHSGTGSTYDTKNRIVRKDFVDSSGVSLSMQYHGRYYATYKYK